jgi:hypothetical protein
MFLKHSVGAALLLAAALLFGGSVALAGGDPPGTISPNINVTAQGGGALITPSVNVHVPLGGGATLQGGVQVPVYVPPSGPATVTGPSFGAGLVIPF